MLCGGNSDPHFPTRGDFVKKVEDHLSRLMENFISVSLKSKTGPANSEKNVYFDSSKSCCF